MKFGVEIQLVVSRWLAPNPGVYVAGLDTVLDTHMVWVDSIANWVDRIFMVDIEGNDLFKRHVYRGNAKAVSSAINEFVLAKFFGYQIPTIVWFEWEIADVFGVPVSDVKRITREPAKLLSLDELFPSR